MDSTHLPEDDKDLDKDFIEKYQKEVMDRLNKAGIKVKPGRRKIQDGNYSGVISRVGERTLNIK